MQDFRISPPEEHEWKQYRSLALEAYRLYPHLYKSDYESASKHYDDYWRAQIRLAQRKKGLYMLCVFREMQMVGYIQLGWDLENPKLSHIGELQEMYITPKAQKQQVGDRLVSIIIAKAQEFELKKIKLAVTATNQAAISLYLKHGFIRVGKYYKELLAEGKYHNELLMERAFD